MKVSTTKYILKEGIQNTYRNKLMSIASIGIVTAALMVFGIFWLIILNLNYNLDIFKQQPEMVIYCNPELEEAKVKQIENVIKNNENVDEFTRVSKKEAFEKLKEIMGNKQSLLEGMDESFLPVSFTLKLKDPEKSSEVSEEFQKMAGVEKVDYARDLIGFITKVTHWVRVISIILIIILLIVSIFIISNAIRLTVFARRREISIMKYIGATDWFIRWPFIIEGAIIGLVGAGISFLLVSYGYSALEIRINTDIEQLSTGFNNFFTLIKIGNIGWKFIAGYFAIGVAIGALGSVISLRKHLNA